MLRTRLLTATAALALFAAPAAFAQDPMTPQTPSPTPMPAPTTPAPTDPAMPAAPEATTPAAPEATTPAAPAQTAATPATGTTVVDVLRSNGQFTTLLTALDAAQLTQTLSSQPAVSIFAPTDAAFAALPEADRTRLMDPANVNELRQLLLYHVVVADVNSSQIQGAKGGVPTANNAQVQLDGTGEALKVDAATIIQADIDASNGAIFAIDQVLNPATSQAAVGDEEAAPAADAVTNDAATDDTATPPAADATSAPADDVATDAAAPPAGETEMTPPAAPVAPTTTTSPTPPAATAPSGEAAVSTTTTASPPVANPTDGQVDDDDTDTDEEPPVPAEPEA